MITQWLEKMTGTRWSGSGELWLDPEGNTVTQYSCELNIDTDSIHYIWAYENETQKGCFTFNGKGAIWVDSWHQEKSVQCSNVPEAWGIFTVTHEYEVPGNPNWGWQSKLSERPNGSLVLQMTNISPWGEDGRAVRMIFAREKA